MNNSGYNVLLPFDFSGYKIILDSGIMNVILCLAGGVIFSSGIGAVSRTILSKTSLV